MKKKEALALVETVFWFGVVHLVQSIVEISRILLKLQLCPLTSMYCRLSKSWFWCPVPLFSHSSF